jgi:hypothetical protein
VDYRCEVYFNGNLVGKHIGLFGAFEFDVKPYMKIGKNLLEIKNFNESTMTGDAFFLGPDRKYGKKIAAGGAPGWDEPGLAKGWGMCALDSGYGRNAILRHARIYILAICMCVRY